MYHPGKVVKVFATKSGDVRSSDSTTQAMLEMWDENIVTFMVDPHIAGDIKDGDVVLVDYNPVSPNAPVPRHLIVKVLKGKTADDTWKKYKKYYDGRKKGTQKGISVVQPAATPEYFG